MCAACCAVLLAADMKALQPDDNEVKELRNHVIIAGYGRVGQIIAQMLSELLIPFVALDVRSDRCVLGLNRVPLRQACTEAAWRF